MTAREITTLGSLPHLTREQEVSGVYLKPSLSATDQILLAGDAPFFSERVCLQSTSPYPEAPHTIHRGGSLSTKRWLCLYPPPIFASTAHDYEYPLQLLYSKQ